MAKTRAPHDPQRERRRRLCRFALALSDLSASTQSCDLMLTERPGMGGAHYWAYHTAIVASYGRPFTENKPLGRIPASSVLRTLTPEQLELHDELLENRNSVAAHSDLRARPVYYMPKGAKMGETGMRSERSALSAARRPLRSSIVHSAGLRVAKASRAAQSSRSKQPASATTRSRAGGDLEAATCRSLPAGSPRRERARPRRQSTHR